MSHSFALANLLAINFIANLLAISFSVGECDAAREQYRTVLHKFCVHWAYNWNKCVWCQLLVLLIRNYVHQQAAAWIAEKMTVASDESYRDPTNLQGKLQKHQAFEAELTANTERVDAVEKVL